MRHFILKIILSKPIDSFVISISKKAFYANAFGYRKAHFQKYQVGSDSIVFVSTSLVSYIVSPCSTMEKAIVWKQVSKYPESVWSKSDLSIRESHYESA